MADVKKKSVSSYSVEYLDYQQTVMYGQHQQELGKAAREAFKKMSIKREKQREKTPIIPYTSTKWGKLKRSFIYWKLRFRYSMVSEWLFLLVLGVSMALLSFGMDLCIQKVQYCHSWLYAKCYGQSFLSLVEWVSFPVLLILFCVYFVSMVSPQAVGSGIPEMKTILRGVVLHEYLTLKVLIAKMIGLIASIGSRLPIGKEGPFVHIASIVATLLNNKFYSFSSPFQNQSRNGELLAAACAVGVACNFAAPIGGVLFSIEVTSTYFAVKNYWRGFFSAVCGAFMFRLLAVWVSEEETITALFKTNFRLEFPYDLKELFFFVIVGVLCGLIGAAFVKYHRSIVRFNRTNKRLRNFLLMSIAIYPLLVTLTISLIKFPSFLGQYIASDLTMKQAVDNLFDNQTWHKLNYTSLNLTNNVYPNYGWIHPDVSIFVTLLLFCVVNFFITAISITMAVPSGVFMPVFLIGAAFGRLIGELISAIHPGGFFSAGTVYHVVPGGYAVVGAASLAGAVTHTISTAVIVFELTGQISHILPVMLAVLISNAIARIFSPSIYESIIKIKSLPYLPDVATSDKSMHSFTADKFMVEDVVFLSKQTTTYFELQTKLRKGFRCYPIVDNPDSMILVGSVMQMDLNNLLITYENQMLSSFAEVEEDKEEDLIFEKQDSSSSEEKTEKVGRFTTTTSEISKTKVKSKNNNVTLPVKPNSSPISVAIAATSGLIDYNRIVDFSKCIVDESPFHLVETTTLHKVHSLFSLLSLQHAYVTKVGKLVGVVSLKEVRNAIEKLNRRSGTNLSKSKKEQTNLTVSMKRRSNINDTDYEDLEGETFVLKMPETIESSTTDLSDSESS